MDRAPVRAILALLLLVAPVAAASLPDVAAVPAAGPSLGPVHGVHRNHDVEAGIQGLVAAHPRYFAYGTHGTSGLGLPLHHAVVTDTEAAGPKQVVVLDGGHHGNEYLGTELVMAFLYWAGAGVAAGDEEVLSLLRTTEVHAVPLVNPDGNYLDTRKNARLVDLNRNYPYMWGGPGSGDSPATFTYRGEAPLSEPETSANVAFLEARDADLWVSMHTGIAEMYWPWGYTHDAPPDHDLFTRLEKPFEDASNGVLDAMQSAELYITSGGNEDYGYGELGIASFVIEVHGDQFRPAYLEPVPAMIQHQLDALVWLVRMTPKIGANVRVHDTEPGAAALRATGDGAVLWLHNNGWGDARNVTVELRDGATVVATRTVDVPERSHLNVTFPGVSAVDGLRVEARWPKLLVETSKELSLAWPPEGVAPSGAGDLAAVPAPGTAAALAAALAGAVLALARGASRRR